MKKSVRTLGIVIFSLLFVSIAVVFNIYELELLPIQFYGALIGVVITAIITVFLLQGQTRSEEEREKSVKVFEKKQEVYHVFLERVEHIITELTEKSIRGNDKTSYENITKLESLVFQFAYLHIHMKEESFQLVIQNLSEIFKTYNEIRLYETYQVEINEQRKSRSDIINNNLMLLMQKITKHLFVISKLLNNDLYGIDKKKENDQILKEMDNLFYNCGLRKLVKMKESSLDA